MPDIGKCPKCDPKSRDVVLIGGYCKHHFANPDDQIERLQHEVKGKDETKKLDTWYKEQIAQIPELCENCHQKIVRIPGLTERTYVAHILPKSKVKSVATHDDNRLFLCWDCHTKYDGRQDKASVMPVVGLAKERFNNFRHLILQKEQKYIPEYLK